MIYEAKYQKMQDGTWGAYIDCGYGKNAIAKPKAGDLVKITTKAGEVHDRIVKCIAVDYASGCKVRLVADAQVAQTANARYQAKVSSTKYDKVVYSNGKKMSAYESVVTEGHGW